jgi:hypothetical protein
MNPVMIGAGAIAAYALLKKKSNTPPLPAPEIEIVKKKSIVSDYNIPYESIKRIPVANSTESGSIMQMRSLEIDGRLIAKAWALFYGLDMMTQYRFGDGTGRSLTIGYRHSDGALQFMNQDSYNVYQWSLSKNNSGSASDKAYQEIASRQYHGNTDDAFLQSSSLRKGGWNPLISNMNELAKIQYESVNGYWVGMGSEMGATASGWFDFFTHHWCVQYDDAVRYAEQGHSFWINRIQSGEFDGDLAMREDALFQAYMYDKVHAYETGTWLSSSGESWYSSASKSSRTGNYASVASYIGVKGKFSKLGVKEAATAIGQKPNRIIPFSWLSPFAAGFGMESSADNIIIGSTNYPTVNGYFWAIQMNSNECRVTTNNSSLKNPYAVGGSQSMITKDGITQYSSAAADAYFNELKNKFLAEQAAKAKDDSWGIPWGTIAFCAAAVALTVATGGSGTAALVGVIKAQGIGYAMSKAKSVLPESLQGVGDVIEMTGKTYMAFKSGDASGIGNLAESTIKKGASKYAEEKIAQGFGTENMAALREIIEIGKSA